MAAPSRRHARMARATEVLLLALAVATADARADDSVAPAAASQPATATAEAQPEHAAAPVDKHGTYPVPPPPFSDGIFPCSECHADQETNPNRRQLTDAHEEIVLEHGPRERWCFDCHNPDNRDVLRMASGATVPFTESYRLCGQCHGDKLRDWKVGVHGKRTGLWDGQKQYLLCAHCHNPHSPRFKPIAPKSPPMRPEDIR